MESKFSLTPLALDVFEAIKQAGGHVYLVGGCVRDFLLKRRSKDIDVEVHHLSFAALKEVLSSFGTVQVMGAAFAVVHLSTLEGYEFALPRIEEKTGLKHQDFNVIVDPDLPLEKACARRDFTINSMLYDIETGTVIDFYSGKKDLKNGILCATNGNHFSEDPLRVLRGPSFMSRYGFKMDPDTKNLCQCIVEEGGLDTLSTERIYTEYCKILMGLYPSQGLNFLRDIHGLPFYLQDLDTTHQRTDYHPEGSVWNHTMLVTDLAALCKHHTSEPVWFMWSALLHDIGKAVDHEMEGSHIQLGAELCKKYKESPLVINAVESHHGDVEPESLIACLVQAADTISAARPGARRETLETYSNRLQQLEDITNGYKGVEKSFAIQAGREIRIMVVPEQVSDADMVIMARDISKQIESELEYPGQIKVNVIRESRIVDYAK